MARTWAADNRITEEPGHVKLQRLVDEWKASLEKQSSLIKCPTAESEPTQAEKKAAETAPQKRRGRPSKQAD